MMLVIARQGGCAYLRSVAAALFRLLAIAAMILMPVGMGMAPAGAAPSHSAGMSQMVGEHCGAKADCDGGKGQMGMHCTAACTALPAGTAVEAGAPAATGSPAPSVAIEEIAGTTPPPATPPPRAG